MHLDFLEASALRADRRGIFGLVRVLAYAR